MKGKLTEGIEMALERVGKASHAPVLSIVGTGRTIYLWVGDDSDGCYATLTGKKELVQLARRILREAAKEVNDAE